MRNPTKMAGIERRSGRVACYPRSQPADGRTVAVVGRQSAGSAMASSVTPTTGLGSWSAVILPADPNHEIPIDAEGQEVPRLPKAKKR
jgi:hypothetical protein